jgi:large subunit ribosomal protein L21
MSKYIVTSGSKQYIVEPNQQLIIDRLSAEIDSTIELPVLFSFDGKTVKSIKAKVLSHPKGKKIRVVKYKSKSNYHKVTGFRPYQTIVEIM